MISRLHVFGTCWLHLMNHEFDILKNAHIWFTARWIALWNWIARYLFLHFWIARVKCIIVYCLKWFIWRWPLDFIDFLARVFFDLKKTDSNIIVFIKPLALSIEPKQISIVDSFLHILDMDSGSLALPATSE